METDSGSEDLDIALFSKKFKVSREKLNQQKKKTKRNKIKEKVRDLNSNSSNRTKNKYDRASDDEPVDSNDDSSVNFKEKPIKRKHKNTENLDSEIVASPLKKAKYKNEYEDNVVVEDGLSSKKRWKTEKQQRSSVLEPFVEPPNPKKEQKKLIETIGTSSEESDLETGSFRRKAFNNRVESKVKQKDIKEKVIKSLKDKNNMEAESDYSDDSRRDLVASPPDSESSDGDTDQESDAETSEMEPNKNLVLNEYTCKGKAKGQQKHAKSNAAIQGNEAKLVKANPIKKVDAVETDSSSDINTDTSDGEETDNESLESYSDIGKSGSDNIKNSSDSVTSKDEKSGGKQLLHKSGKDVIHERKKRQREPTDLDEDNMTVDSVKEEDNDPYAAIKKELANIPLEDLVKIKDKLGLKVFSQIMQGGKKAEPNQKRVFKRENKNRPMEMSSKRPVPIIRQTHVPKKKVARDPRFDDLSGDFKEEYFERNYSFLQDVKAKEKEVIKKKLLKSKNEEKKEKLQYLLNRMNQQEKASQQKQRRKKIETTVKEKEKQLVKAGKNPYFLKKADRKKLELAEKYKELQKSGKVDQYLSRKRKKNAHKEKKKLPGKLARR